MIKISKMSNRSKVGRIALLPVFVPVAMKFSIYRLQVWPSVWFIRVVKTSLLA